MAPTIHQDYANAMGFHGYGHAFYEPESAQVVRPGLCGYIDNSGIWQTIVDTTDAGEVNGKGFSELGSVAKMRASKRYWGPKTSDSINIKLTEVKAGTSGLPAGIPADVSVLWTYSHSADFGAILLCPEEVALAGFSQKSPFREWARENAQLILKNAPDAKEHGIFIITSTYSTTEVFTTAWRNNQNIVEVGAKAVVEGIADVGVKMQYFRSEGAGSWIRADVKVAPLSLNNLLADDSQGGRRNVVFFGGLYFKYTRFRLGKDHKVCLEHEAIKIM